MKGAYLALKRLHDGCHYRCDQRQPDLHFPDRAGYLQGAETGKISASAWRRTPLKGVRRQAKGDDAFLMFISLLAISH